MDTTSKGLYLIAYANAKHGWDLTFPEGILKVREDGTDLVGIFNRGILGCPKIRVSEEDLEQFLTELEKKQAESMGEDQTGPREEEDPLPDPGPELGGTAVAVFTQIPGVTETIQERLYAAGIHNFFDIQEIAENDPDQLLEIQGLGPGTLQKIRDYLGVED